MSNEIKLVVKPVISHKLKEVGDGVSKRIQDLNVDKLVATEDTVQSLKKLRAELNSELSEFESQRKDVKNALLLPYSEFEPEYNTEIRDKYNWAITTLKDNIDKFDSLVRAEKKRKLEAYFTELCASESVDFVRFEQAVQDVNISTSEKKYKEQMCEFIARVKDDLTLINAGDNVAETLIEYKSHLNASRAVTTVKQRIESERLEKERLKKVEFNTRASKLRSIGIVKSEDGTCFVADCGVSITVSEVENLDNQSFGSRFVELQLIVEESNKPKVLSEPTQIPNVKAVIINTPVKFPPPVGKIKDVNSIITKADSPDEVEICFKVVCNEDKLQGIADYFKVNGIKFFMV